MPFLTPLQRLSTIGMSHGAVRWLLHIPVVFVLISCTTTQGTLTTVPVQQGEPTHCEEQTSEVLEASPMVPAGTIKGGSCPLNRSKADEVHSTEQGVVEDGAVADSQGGGTEGMVPEDSRAVPPEAEVSDPNNDAAVEQTEMPESSDPQEMLEPLICNNDPECEEQGLGVATGTGFMVSSDGYVVTNDHVIADYRELYVIFGGEPLDAAVVDRDSDLDVALLKIEASTDALPVDLITPRKGEEVAVIGYPSVQLLGNEVKATFGHINSLSGPENTPFFLQFSAATQPGNSGSPLLNNKGSVIGLVTASLNQASALEQTGTLAQNVNFALKTEFLLPILELVPGWQSPDAARKDMEATEVVEQSEDSVVLILNIFEGGSPIQTERRKISEAGESAGDSPSFAKEEQEAQTLDAVEVLPAGDSETQSGFESATDIDAAEVQELGYDDDVASVETNQDSSDSSDEHSGDEPKVQADETEDNAGSEHGFKRYKLRTKSEDEG